MRYIAYRKRQSMEGI